MLSCYIICFMTFYVYFNALSGSSTQPIYVNNVDSALEPIRIQDSKCYCFVHGINQQHSLVQPIAFTCTITDRRQHTFTKMQLIGRLIDFQPIAVYVCTLYTDMVAVAVGASISFGSEATWVLHKLTKNTQFYS